MVPYLARVDMCAYAVSPQEKVYTTTTEQPHQPWLDFNDGDTMLVKVDVVF